MTDYTAVWSKISVLNLRYDSSVLTTSIIVEDNDYRSPLRLAVPL